MTACPECGIPFGESPPADMPMCWFCNAGLGKSSPPLPLPDPPSTGGDDYCCEEHLPSRALNFAERMEHCCPVCGWSPSGSA